MLGRVLVVFCTTDGLDFVKAWYFGFHYRSDGKAAGSLSLDAVDEV